MLVSRETIERLLVKVDRLHLSLPLGRLRVDAVVSRAVTRDRHCRKSLLREHDLDRYTITQPRYLPAPSPQAVACANR